MPSAPETIAFTTARKAPARTELHAVGVLAEQVESKPHDLDWSVLASRGFEGNIGQVMVVGSDNGPVAVVGLGKEATVDGHALRRAGAGLARAARRHKKISSAVLAAVPDTVDQLMATQAFAEGIVLGAYGYTDQKSKPTPSKLAAVTLVGGTGAKVNAAIQTGADRANAVNFARDLVNEPGGSLTPVKFARKATAVAKDQRLTAKIMDLADIKKARLGGLLGVNRGSEQQPRFVQLTYTPKGKRKGHVALVGKGITFDAGGLSIKTGAGMMTMKCDMAGAGAVLGAMSAIADVAPPVKVTAYMPLTDNMLGGDATRPGDVLTIRNKKTVEVLNTDAEGRLVLADALSLASEAKPDAIIDLATLTGAAMAALGPRIAAAMGTNQDWLDQVLAAGTRSGERLWAMPLPTDYRRMLDSPVADMKNIGGPYAGALTAGLFLKEFVAEGIPWVHLDIAGPAFSADQYQEHPKGGTGFAVRLLLDLLEHFEPLK